MALSVGTQVTFNNNAPFTVVGDKGVVVAVSEGNAAPYELKMEDGRTRFASSDELDAAAPTQAAQLEARIAQLEQDIRTAHDQLAAARYELQQMDRQPEVTCTADKCVGLLGEADHLASRAREAHTFAGVSRDPQDREFARDLEARSDALMNHIVNVHPDYLPEPGEY